MKLNIDDLATLVLGILARADAGTIVTVHPNGAVDIDPPGRTASIVERREPFAATFVANHRTPSHAEVVRRIEHGLRKFDRVA